MSAGSGRLTVDGAVVSSVELTQRHVGGYGALVLRMLAVIFLMVFLVVLLVNGAMMLLFPVAVLLAVVWLFRGFDSAMGMTSSIARGSWAMSRAAVQPRGMPNGAGHEVVDVASFRLLGNDGRSYDCEILGHLNSPVPRLSDPVVVEGRVRRDGILQVRTLVNGATGVRLSPRTPLAVRRLQASNWLAPLLAFAIAALIIAEVLAR